MDLNDLKFTIKDAGISSADGELTISEGILSGVISNAILPEDCKTILTITAKDGQTKEIKVNWKAVTPILEVSGFDVAYAEGMADVFNGTYIIRNLNSNSLLATGEFKSVAGNYYEKSVSIELNNSNTEIGQIVFNAFDPDFEPPRKYFFGVHPSHGYDIKPNVTDLTTCNKIEFVSVYDTNSKPVTIEIIK